MIKLMDHQQRCVNQYSNRSVLLAHQMGTGKTITAISIHKNHGALIVCPANLKQNWLTELEKMNETEVQVVETAKDEIQNKKWLIVSYSLIEKLTPHIQLYNRMICDESHYIKGSSKRSKAVLKIAKGMSVVTLLTGTAVMNRPIELWNQLTAVNATITKEMNRMYFSKRYCDGFLQQMGHRRFWREDGATNLSELRERIAKDVDIVKKSEVLDLPPKVVQTHHIELNADQKREYKNKWDEYITWLESNPEYFTEYVKKERRQGKTLNTLVTKEMQLENILGARQLVEMQKLRQVTSLAKVDYFLTQLEELGDQQAIVFTEFVQSIERLNEGLRKAKIKYSTLKEPNAVQDFQAKKTQIFTANILSGGQGLNLQNASNVFILDRHWTPGQNEQAEDRVHRKGQTEQCNIYYVTCIDTVDEIIEKTNAEKKQNINKIMD